MFFFSVFVCVCVRQGAVSVPRQGPRLQEPEASRDKTLLSWPHTKSLVPGQTAANDTAHVRTHTHLFGF